MRHWARSTFPVRQETVVQAWEMTGDQELSERFQAQVLRALGPHARRPVELMILVTLVAKRGRERDLAKAAAEFAAATNRLERVISSTLYRAASNPGCSFWWRGSWIARFSHRTWRATISGASRSPSSHSWSTPPRRPSTRRPASSGGLAGSWISGDGSAPARDCRPSPADPWHASGLGGS